MDVCLLGTGGLKPLPERFLASAAVSCNGVTVLIDCGEGTQVSMRKHGINPYDIGLILLTHMHGDHVAGLPGVLLGIAATERRAPVVIAGPPPLTEVVRGLTVIVPYLPYELRLMPLPEKISPREEEPYLVCGLLEVYPFSVKHHIACLGYRLHLPRLPKFDARAAARLGVPVEQWKVLQHGHEVEVDGRWIQPSEVLGEPRKGLTVVYTTDTLPVPQIAEAAQAADLLICEGMYGEEAKRADLRDRQHMMMQDAARLAATAGATELWITHFSPANMTPEDYIEELCAIFPGTVIGRDGLCKKFIFG